MARKPDAAKRPPSTHGPTMTAMPPISDQVVRNFLQVFKLLADETRLRILLYLAQSGELHVTDLCGRLGQSQPAVSHHLALLRVSKLVEVRREGNRKFYSVRGESFGELLADVLGATGKIPNRVRFRKFLLSHEGH